MSKKLLFITVLLALAAAVVWLNMSRGEGLPVFSPDSDSIVLINEVMTSNKSTLFDSEGNSSDWIELFNSGNAPVNLHGFGLSDDPSEPGKWIFPDISINPNSYLIVYASGKETYHGNELHAGFRLSSRGETLVFSDPQGTVIEKVEIPAAEDGCSYGRSFEQPGIWVVFDRPSPGYPNSEEGIRAFEAGKYVENSSLLIQEVMADNISTLQDENGDYPDWLEICNNSDSTIDLSGFFLSNSKENLLKWKFPELTLEPEQCIVVFCSGKNRQNPQAPLHTSFKISKSMETLYLSNLQGNVLDTVEIRNLPDDVSLVRDTSRTWSQTRQPTPGFPNTPDGYKEFIESKARKETFVIWEVMSRNENTISDENGVYNDWLEIMNTTSAVLNLKDHWLSDDSGNIRKWRFPSCEVQPGQSVIVFLSPDYTDSQGDRYLHASFALDGLGDVLFLSDGEGNVLQRLDLPEMTAGVSYGRITGDTGYYYFSHPTPGLPNDAGSRATAYCGEPVFSVSGGFYTSPFSLAIEASEEGSAVHYTVDGSEPGLNSPVFSGHLDIDKTCVVRARAYKNGYLPGPVVTHSFFFESHPGFVIISISTDPENLWSEETGIYTMGKNAEKEYPYKGANFWQDWEKPAHIEFYETDGQLGFSLNAGIAIHGEYTRGADQKSFAIEARKKYGDEFINYPVFPEKQIYRYQSIVLRNSGQDNGNTKIRDVLISQLMKETGLDYQAYRPAVLYLNGEYWGVYTLRESTDKNFLADNHPGIDRENLDIIEGNTRIHQGDYSNFKALTDYIKSHDLSVDANYRHVKTLIDVDNFIDYQIAVIYGANTDNGNIKFWRERTEGSRWRWILFDFDMAFRRVDHDTVSHVFNPEGTGAGNWFSTTIQMGLLQNQEFREQFLRRLAWHMKTTFEPEHVISVINSLAADLEPEMKRNYTKWQGSCGLWNTCLETLRNFFRNRPDYVRRYIQQYFSLTDEQMREYGF